VSWPDDLHDPERDVSRLDNLVLAALGESVDPEFSAHFATCSECRAELEALSHTADLARSGHRSDGESRPSPAVWDSIAAELGLGDAGLGHAGVGDAAPRHEDAGEAGLDSVPHSTDVPSIDHSAGGDVLPLAPHRGRADRRTPGGSRSWVLGVAAAVLAVVAGAAGYAIGHSSDADEISVAASAQLSAMPGGPAQGKGEATIVETSEGEQLSVTTVGLPPRNGYYEVWLFNPDLNQMVAVGTLDGKHNGTFPIPSGLDPASYRVVDVSAQKFDGNPQHQQSVLRGQLVR
jgi:anti-sigma-K factor RskA